MWLVWSVRYLSWGREPLVFIIKKQQQQRTSYCHILPKALMALAQTQNSWQSWKGPFYSCLNTVLLWGGEQLTEYMYHFSYNSFVFLLLDGKNSSGSKRYNRKREPSYPKNENFSNQSRRSSSQKSKTFNKMPPQRGGGSSKLFSSSFNGGRRDEVWDFRSVLFRT